MKALQIADKVFSSRLFLGTGKFSSHASMNSAIEASGSELVTVALKRVRLAGKDGELDIAASIKATGVSLLPNTSGARSAKEAVLAAELAREALGTHWLKLEIHPDPRYLLPDPIETFLAAKELVSKGFVVLPYIHADPVLCKRLEDVGVAAVMPLAAPIGSNAGLLMKPMLQIIIEQASVPVIVDAGLGAPSHAAEAIELGADAVLVNTAIAVSPNPALMAQAFKQAVLAAEMARQAGLAAQGVNAEASSPLTEFLVAQAEGL